MIGSKDLFVLFFAIMLADVPDDPEYPGVKWVKGSYILTWLADGTPMPRHQDLPAKAFGTLKDATRVFAVTHPWLDRWHPDPQGIHMEILRTKLKKMHEQLMLDTDDVLFFDYLCLPQAERRSGNP